jgi:hypothetical protein
MALSLNHCNYPMRQFQLQETDTFFNKIYSSPEFDFEAADFDFGIMFGFTPSGLIVGSFVEDSISTIVL